ncbi:MAG: trypsin-like serine protease [Bryobacteraceae bacterium]
MRIRRIVSWFGGVLLLGASLPLPAIVINDTNSAGYITGNSEFTGVVKILINSGSAVCSGALISASQVLTAGHCIAGGTDWSVTFETASGASTVGVSSTLLHPLFQNRPAPLDSLQEYDIGILTLAALAPLDAEIYGLKTDYSGVTFSSVLDVVGYGRGGNPTVGQLSNGTRRHAQNTPDGVLGSLSLVPLPDLPLYMTMIFGEGLANEGLPHAGDSGGPALLGNQILGISSFGNLPRTTPMLTGTVYVSGYMSLANEEIGGWVVDHTIPEPGTLFLVGVVLIGASLVLKRHHV